MVAVLLAAPPALVAVCLRLGADHARQHALPSSPCAAATAPAEDDAFDDEDEGDEGMLALGAIAHWWLSLRALSCAVALAATAGRRAMITTEMEPRASGWRRAAERVECGRVRRGADGAAGRARVEPEFFAAMVDDRSASTIPTIPTLRR